MSEMKNQASFQIFSFFFRIYPGRQDIARRERRETGAAPYGRQFFFGAFEFMIQAKYFSLSHSSGRISRTGISSMSGIV